MTLSRSSIIITLLVAVGLLIHQGSSHARSGDGAPTTTVVASPGTAPPSGAVAPSGAAKSGGLVNANSIFFGCAVGTTMGALVTALPPLVGWTFYAGALPAVVAMIATSGIGCTIGLFGGVIVSTFSWLFDKIGSAWSAVFG